LALPRAGVAGGVLGQFAAVPEVAVGGRAVEVPHCGAVVALPFALDRQQ